jgi:hypothetical protein
MKTEYEHLYAKKYDKKNNDINTMCSTGVWEKSPVPFYKTKKQKFCYYNLKTKILSS